MGLENVSGGSGGFYSLDNVLYFPPFTEDALVFCAEVPITRTEYFNAGALDIRAEVSLIIDTESDVPSALKVQYKEKVYAVYRRYLMANGYTQLYLSEKAGVS